MSWNNLFNNVYKFTDEGVFYKNSKNDFKYEIIKANPDIFWYPGSGTDLYPFILDVPDNPTKYRLFPNFAKDQKKPVILWMNDYRPLLLNFPKCISSFDLSGEIFRDNFEIKFLEIEGFAVLVEDHSVVIPFYIFKINITNNHIGNSFNKSRPKDGDDYIGIFTFCESEFLFNNLFLKNRFTIKTVALIWQGGYSLQRNDFSQYEDIPRLLRNNQGYIGRTQYIIQDLYKIKSYIAKCGHWGFNGSFMTHFDEFGQ